MFKAPFSFEGRIRRTEFGLSYLIYLIASIIISVIAEDGGIGEAVLVLYLPLLWFLTAQGAKRCHDRNHSGWYQLIPFYFLWMIFAEGDFADNEYGPSPKGMGITLDIENQENNQENKQDNNQYTNTVNE